MDTKFALAVAGVVAVVGAALLAFFVYGLADAARWVYRRSTLAARAAAIFIIATCAMSTRARGHFCIKFGRR